MGVACHEAQGHGEVLAHAAAEGQVWVHGREAVGVCVSSRAHITINGHADVLGVGLPSGTMLMSKGCAELRRVGPAPHWLQHSGGLAPPLIGCSAPGPTQCLGTTVELVLVVSQGRAGTTPHWL